MSISSIQKQRKIKEFQHKLLQQGIEPNNYELNRMLSEYFDTHSPGTPCYSPILQKPYEESNKDDYNHNFSTFKEDIETVYEANIEVNNKAVAMQQYYDLEKNKVRNAIAKLQLRVENVSDALKSSSHTKQYVQVFDDMYDIEFYGNAKRNIPYTTAFIDLLQKKVYTETTASKVNKISMSNATIQIERLHEFRSVESKGDKDAILSDTISDLYILSCISTSDSEKTLEIIVDIGTVTEFNMISFGYTSTKEMPCELYLSEDGINYVAVYDVSSRDYIEWHFNTKAARYIKIICHKNEPDGLENHENGTAFYNYDYVFKNISIAKESFESKSIFVSKLIDFNDLSSVIKLDATDRVFNNTRIDYFIGFDNGIDKVGWDAIENHKEHDLFMFEKHHKIVNSHVNTEFGSVSPELHLYKLFQLPKTVNRNSIKLTAGYNMWSVKRYNHKNGDSEDIQFSLATGDFSEHVSHCNMQNIFMDCDNYDSFKIQTNVLYIFTQYVKLDTSMNLYDTFMRLIDNIKTSDNHDAVKEVNFEMRVFLNGYEVVKSDMGLFSFGLRKGVNKIQIALYCKDKNATTYTLHHNMNFKSLTNDVFACVPMRYTSNTILEKTIGDTYSYYTIKDNWIYVKCNPNDMINSDIEDMGYFLTYSALRNDMRYYFKDNHLKFRIMAVLTSNDRNVSPEIINFRITGK